MTCGIWPLLPQLTLEEIWWPDGSRNSPAGVKGCFLYSSGEERLASRPLLADICQLVRTGYILTQAYVLSGSNVKITETNIQLASPDLV